MPARINHVGYVGLGTMGGSIARNLAKAGFIVTVWNRTRRKAEELAQATSVFSSTGEGTSPPGAAGSFRIADSLADLGRAGCDAIILNVNDGAAVRAVLFGANGLAASLSAGTLVIDNSTIAPHEAQAVAGELASRGIKFLDAPVSGGASGAAAGTLSIMVGGDPDVFERCLPLFRAIGKTVTHLGPVGMGQACKACNQVAVAVNLLGVCEAAALAKKLGLDSAKMLEVLGGGGAASQQLKNYGAKIFAGDLKPGFMVKLMLKDLGIVRASAEAQDLPLAATALAEDFLRTVAANGGAELGTQAMSQVLEQRGNFKFGGSNATACSP